MNKYAQSKDVLLLTGTVATDATNSSMVDRLGYDFAKIKLVMRPATATNSSAKWTALKLMESDTTAVSDASNINGFIGTTNTTAVSSGTAMEFVIPANNTTVAFGGTAQNGGGQQIDLSLDLRGRKRYLFLISQANASHQTAFALAQLYKGEKMPLSTTERNVAAVKAG